MTGSLTGFLREKKKISSFGRNRLNSILIKDYTAFIPHTSDLRDGEKYSCSFEEFYTETPVSKFNKDTLGYLPLLIQLDNNKKAVLLEADVQDYPGMFVQLNQQAPHGLAGKHLLPTLLKKALGVRARLNYMVRREPIILQK